MSNYPPIHLIHFGPGKVGRSFLKQLNNATPYFKKQFGVSLVVVGVFNSWGGIISPDGISTKIIKQIIETKSDEIFKPISYSDYFYSRRIEKYLPIIVIDTTASKDMVETIHSFLDAGAFAVLSNKIPLSSSLEDYSKLHMFKDRLFYETTVGAGLPVLSTIDELLATGDEIIEIKGCLSGSLNNIFTLLENGIPFSKALKKTEKAGYTEPDVREDLSGIDVVRKAIILGGSIGNDTRFTKINHKSVIPKRLANLNDTNIYANSSVLDKYFKELIGNAQKDRNCIRYVASIRQKSLKIGLEYVPLSSDIGSVKGADNIIAIKTKRYNKQPLIIKGPGAGINVTAAGVIGDVSKIIKKMSGS